MDILLAFDNVLLSGDLQVSGGDLVTDNSLQSAVIISLFTDRIANTDDALPERETDRRGWWADDLSALEDDRIGSRLWLLGREKEIPEVLRRAEEYAQEALQWLIDDGIVEHVSIIATAPVRGQWHLAIALQKPDGTEAEYAYQFLWNGVGV